MRPRAYNQLQRAAVDQATYRLAELHSGTKMAHLVGLVSDCKAKISTGTE
jgi:hypothetical protein